MRTSRGSSTLSTDEQTGASAAGILDSSAAAYNRLGEEIEDLIEDQATLLTDSEAYARYQQQLAEGSIDSIEDQIAAREEEMAALLAQQVVLSEFEQDLKVVEEAEAARAGGGGGGGGATGDLQRGAPGSEFPRD